MRAGSGSSIANSAGSITSGTPSGSRAWSTRKFRTANGGHAVDLDVQAENQRGDVTTPGHATSFFPAVRVALSCCPIRREAHAP